MKSKEIRDIEIVAENHTDDERSYEAMSFLREEVNPTYHWCPDWDYMVICDTDSEWEACGCVRWKELIQKASEKPPK